jgi:hypothetical protein
VWALIGAEQQVVQHLQQNHTILAYGGQSRTQKLPTIHTTVNIARVPAPELAMIPHQLIITVIR